MKLMYITNDPTIAKIVEESGVDWIFIDLEILGKEERQGHLDTVISRHSFSDIKIIKNVLSKSELLVRINPINDNSKFEVETAIENGADIVMLPFFKTSEEVDKFIKLIDGRSKTCLLLETPEAVSNIDSILNIAGIDYIHIGLNDLHLGYHKKFMFELLTDGTTEYLTKKISRKKIEYGFGGIARLGLGDLPAEKILIEHQRLGSNMVILSRSFCDLKKNTNIEDIKMIFKDGVKDIRESVTKNKLLSQEELIKNYGEISDIVEEILKRNEKNDK